jgi:hypothetical protein
MLFKEIIAVYSENRTKQIQNEELKQVVDVVTVGI